MTIKSWESRTTPNTTLGEQLVLMQAEINELRAALAERDGIITHELEEQLRLNSIGAEREYVLLGKVAQLERERDKLWAEIANLKAQIKSELASHESWQNEHLRIDGEQCRRIRELEAERDVEITQSKIYEGKLYTAENELRKLKYHSRNVVEQKLNEALTVTAARDEEIERLKDKVATVKYWFNAYGEVEAENAAQQEQIAHMTAENKDFQTLYEAQSVIIHTLTAERDAMCKKVWQDAAQLCHEMYMAQEYQGKIGYCPDDYADGIAEGMARCAKELAKKAKEQP